MNTALAKNENKEAEKLAKKIEIITAHFAKKAEEARAFLKANPVPKELLKK
ncbi:hypothetical protein [Dyadobacter fanqingshengii]|uniref:Uncharacterized protein n=1 Tax=Dyadobacter fanqingshengii TaxID=2906443 RepID=A0A9X1P9T1_9BACT|nr:hypothetical protein [Dyadobacter fanqingshengii]MCF0039973.1 hypothetical protein [Dyadobacter fanqingshengii]USJ38273.1 hypothetical protein NFI81_10900 [Dyadobacter fanqingshengii]